MLFVSTASPNAHTLPHIHAARCLVQPQAATVSQRAMRRNMLSFALLKGRGHY